MTPENYKIQVLLRTEGFFRQQKNSRVISKIAGADPGGVQGSKDPPGPQRGGPGPLFQNEENSIYYLQFYLSTD